MRWIAYALLLFSVFPPIASHAQEPAVGTVAGRIVDSTGKQNLAEASVSIMGSLDSTVKAFTLTDKNGDFTVRNLKSGNYRLVISFQGFEPITRRFSISLTDTSFNFGTLYFQRRSEELEAVTIARPPITLHKDTVEYQGGMYTTKPNAVAEDLLKKLPGIQVDKSGNITAQGETVQRVLVNGKRFFSDDPKLATRNLPPDIIDKIQVFDDLSDQSKFTGFDDGNRVKTINITTKKDKREGYFGRLIAGLGTDQNYDESVNLHRFDGDQQVSLLGQANDVNKQNFTIQDILGTSGGRRGGAQNTGATNPSASGVTTIWAAGANYRDNWSPNTDAYGSYFFNSQHVATDQSSYTKNILQDSFTVNNQNQSSIQRTENHRIFFNLEQRFDSNNSLIFRPNISFQNTMPNGSSNTQTVDNNGGNIYNSAGRTTSTNSGFNINNANLQLRHKFEQKFRTISLDISATANVNNGNGYNFAVNTFYRPSYLVDTINQYYNDSLHSLTFSPTLSYTQPIAKNQILEFNYNYTYNRNNSINNTFGYDNNVKGFNVFDSLFSNSYRFTSNANRFTLNWRIQQPQYNLSIGSGIQLMDFISLNTTKDITIAHNYVNLTPTINFRYDFSKTQHFRLYYMGRTGNPSVAQLQPIATTSDSLNFQVGNPNLKPQFTHSLRILYASFDPVSQHVLFATLNASTTVNDIQNSIVLDTSGKRTTSYVNLNGTYNVSGYLNYGFPLKKPKSNLNFISSVNYSQSQSLVGNTGQAQTNTLPHDFVRNTVLGETISWTTNLKKNFDMNFSSATNYTIARNSTAPGANENYWSQIFSTEITAYTNNGWLIATTFDYTFYGNRPPGYNANVPLLSPSIAKSLFKKKNGEIRLYVFDALNQNSYVNASVTSGQAQYTRSNVLTRYAMLTFTYNLNNFPGSQQRRMPGFFPRGMEPRRGNGPPGGGGSVPMRIN